MKSSPWIFFLGLLALGMPLAAQSAPDWYLDKPITDIRFDGLVTVSKSDIEGVTKPYLGQKFTETLFQDLQTALYNLDYFDGLIVPTAIKANDQGSAVILLFKVTEKPSVEALEFTGNDKLRSSELQSVLTVKKGDLVNPAKVQADERAVENYYRERGFLDIEVSSTIQEPKDRRTTVVFQVKEGLQTAVKSVTFQGNSAVSTSTLMGLLQTKAQSFFDSGLFKEDAFSKDLRSVETYYWNHGYLDARITDVQRTIAFDTAADRNMLSIVLTVKEGETLLFGGFTFAGNQVFSTDTLGALVRQPTGKTLSKERLEADYQRVVDLYLENGYIFNNISRQEVREGNTVSYKISIIERPRAHIESLIVKGNTKTKDKVILREIPVEVGDVFSKSKIIEGIRNLYNLQYFNSVTPETPQGSADGLMDLVFNVEEGKTADVSFGLAFSGTSDFPISAQMKWSDRNFGGNGQTVSIDSTLSRDTQSLTLSSTENWFLDQRLTLGGSFGFTHTVNTKIDQDVQGPTYSDSEIPDPYQEYDYVFSKSTTYAGVSYAAGATFPGVITSSSDSRISQYDLITRYQYDLNNGTVKKNAQMQYDSWKFTLALNTGYSWYTGLGRFGLGTGEKSTLQMVTYDSTIYRPASQSLRDNLDQWMLANQVWLKGTWDTRDLVYNPSDGFLLSETLTLGGGLLGGSTHFTRTDTRAEGYWKFFSWPVAESYSLDLVAKARTAFSFLGPTFGGPGTLDVQPTDELYIDGMMSGRGWGYQSGGKATWTSGFEIRTPVPFVGQLLWIDTFVDDAVFVDSAQTDPALSNPFSLPLASHDFAWGSGLRIVSPQFPLALYLAKPFKVSDSGAVTWQTGDGIFGTADLKLVVAFGMEY